MTSPDRADSPTADAAREVLRTSLPGCTADCTAPAFAVCNCRLDPTVVVARAWLALSTEQAVEAAVLALLNTTGAGTDVYDEARAALAAAVAHADREASS